MPLVGGWQIARTHRTILNDAEQNAASLSRVLAQDMAHTSQALGLLLLDVVERVERGERDDLNTFLARRADGLGPAVAVYVIDERGKVVAGSQNLERPAALSTEAVEWHRTHDGAEPHIGSASGIGMNGEIGIPISRRITTDGVFGGAVVATLSASYFDRFFKTLVVGPNGSAALWSDSERLLVRYPPSPENANRKLLDETMRAGLHDRSRGAFRGISPIDGVSRIIALDRVPNIPLLVSTSISVDDVLQNWWRETKTEIVFLVCASSMLTLLAFSLERSRRKFERNLAHTRKIDRLYRILAENSSDLVLLMSRDEASKIIYVSPAVTSLTGWSPEEFESSTLEDRLVAEDVAEVRSDLASLSAAQPKATGFHRLLVKGGGSIWVEAVFQLAVYDALGDCVVYTARDVTLRKEAEEALSTNEARYRMLTDTSGDVVTQLDLNFRRVYVSPACRLLLGYEPEEMIGVRPSATIHPEDAASAKELADKLVAGQFEGDRATSTHRVLHKDGHYVWVEAGMNLVRDGTSGAPKYVICALRDVTERQRIAQHLENARVEAENAARQKSEFVANMSHELRTPLTAILGIHDLMAGDLLLSAQNRRYLSMARDAGETLLAIINDVLDMSKMDVGLVRLEQVTFDVSALAEECRCLVDLNASRRSLRLTVAVDTPARLVGDPTRVKQILLNLMSNAVKFTHQGAVTARLTYSHETSRLRIEVADTGIGIAMDSLPRLFDRFSQADTSITRSYGGTGLGLAISKRLVDMMNGEIGVLSNPGQGSTFWLELPLSVGPDESLAPLFPSGAARSIRRVLLAEDNALSQEVISAMLQRHGCDITVVDNGAAAAAATLAPNDFDVVLMDLQMPIMDGLTATKTIRDAQNSTPIIGLTANAMVEDITKCISAGMQAHVAKPIDWPHLLAVIERVVGGSGASDSADERDVGAEGVLDESKLATLVGLVGPERLRKMLNAFVSEVEKRTEGVDTLAAKDFAARVHTLVSLAGQFGFAELSTLCASIEAEIRVDQKPVRISEFKDAAKRAVKAAVRTNYAKEADDVAA